MNGCSNCRYCKVYRSNTYWDPDEYECVGMDRPDVDFGGTPEDVEEIFTRVWENGEEWKDDEEPICPAWEELIEQPDAEYWDRYAYEENRYDKDEAE